MTYLFFFAAHQETPIVKPSDMRTLLLAGGIDESTEWSCLEKGDIVRAIHCEMQRRTNNTSKTHTFFLFSSSYAARIGHLSSRLVAVNQQRREAGLCCETEQDESAAVSWANTKHEDSALAPHASQHWWVKLCSNRHVRGDDKSWRQLWVLMMANGRGRGGCWEVPEDERSGVDGGGGDGERRKRQRNGWQKGAS